MLLLLLQPFKLLVVDESGVVRLREEDEPERFRWNGVSDIAACEWFICHLQIFGFLPDLEYGSTTSVVDRLHVTSSLESIHYG